MPSRALRFLPAAVFIAVPALLILPIVFSGKMLYGGDVVGLFHYSRITIAEAFRAGRLPVWDPHVMAGFPLLAAAQGAVFYPPTWLCIVLPAGLFWTFSAMAHLSLSGIFGERWLRRGLGVGPGAAAVGGFVFMMSGYLVTHLYAGHVNYVWAYPWMAAFLWRLERYLAVPSLRRGVLLSVVLALLFLAGVPQYVFFAGLLAVCRGALFAGKDRGRLKIAAAAAGWLALGLLFAAPQLLPTIELVTQMQRGGAKDEEFMTSHSMPPENLLLLLFPRWFGDVVHRPYTGKSYLWETLGFVGVGTLILAAAAGAHRQRRFWAVVAGAGLLLALGPATPAYGAFAFVVPGAGMFRGPGRYLLLFTIAMTALAALGFERLWSDPRRALRGAAVVLAAAASIDLLAFGTRYFQGQDEKYLRWSDEAAAVLTRAVGDGRVASSGPAPIPAIGKTGLAGLDHVCGYDPMMLRRYAELINAARGAPIEVNIPLLAAVGEHRLIHMLGARVWLAWGVSPNRSWPQLGRLGDAAILENPRALPRAWVVNHAVVIESAEERLVTMAHGDFDPRRTVVLESLPADAPPVPSASPGTASVASRAPGDYRIEAENGADAYLVLSEAWYPGWTAEVDGKPAEVLPADHLLQAVRLPPGRHVVRFRYRSRFLSAGFLIAALAAFVPVAIVLVRRRRR